MCKISWKYLQTLQKKFSKFLSLWNVRRSSHTSTNDCHASSLTHVNLARSQSQSKLMSTKRRAKLLLQIGYGRESTGCKYDKEPSCAHSNFTHTQSTMDRHDSQITPIRMHACAPNDIIKISGLVDFFLRSIFMWLPINLWKIKSLHPAKISRYTVLHLIHSLCEFLILGWVIDT